MFVQVFNPIVLATDDVFRLCPPGRQSSPWSVYRTSSTASGSFPTRLRGALPLWHSVAHRPAKYSIATRLLLFALVVNLELPARPTLVGLLHHKTITSYAQVGGEAPAFAQQRRIWLVDTRPGSAPSQPMSRGFFSKTVSGATAVAWLFVFLDFSLSDCHCHGIKAPSWHLQLYLLVAD